MNHTWYSNSNRLLDIGGKSGKISHCKRKVNSNKNKMYFRDLFCLQKDECHKTFHQLINKSQSLLLLRIDSLYPIVRTIIFFVKILSEIFYLDGAPQKFGLEMTGPSHVPPYGHTLHVTSE